MRNWQLPLTFVLFMTGILLVSAIEALQGQEDLPTKTQSENLIAKIETQEKELSELEKQIDANRKSLDKYQESISSGKKEEESLKYQLDRLKILSGISDVEGAGIIIHLDDNNKGYEAAKNKDPEHVTANDFLIHDKHLLYIVYELREAGAEAISINGQRVVSSSDIRCMGTTIGVNTIALSPPFVIRAIGDPDRLSESLERKKSQYYSLKMAGYPASIEKQSKLIIGAYKGSYQYSYAQPKEEQ
jgi:uncharacterized protein YlxW (UPF0749 family)